MVNYSCCTTVMGSTKKFIERGKKMTKKAKKIVALLAVLALATAVIPAAVFAANTVEISATTEGSDDSTINVTGTITGEGDITLLALKSSESLGGIIPASIDKNAIMYIDQKTAQNGSVDISFKLRETDVEGDYLTIFMGGTDVAQYVSQEIVLTSNEEPAITADDVELVGTNAFRTVIGDGYNIAIITADEIDPETKTIKIGDKALYYSPEKDYFIGLVTGYADAAAVAEATTIIDEASETFIYGKAQATYAANARVTAADYGIVRRIALRKESNLTDKQLIASDVAGATHDGQIAAPDYAIIRRFVLRKISALPIVGAE